LKVKRHQKVQKMAPSYRSKYSTLSEIGLYETLAATLLMKTTKNKHTHKSQEKKQNVSENDSYLCLRSALRRGSARKDGAHS